MHFWHAGTFRGSDLAGSYDLLPEGSSDSKGAMRSQCPAGDRRPHTEVRLHPQATHITGHRPPGKGWRSRGGGPPPPPALRWKRAARWSRPPPPHDVFSLQMSR